MHSCFFVDSFEIFEIFDFCSEAVKLKAWHTITSHSAYVATATKSNGVKIDGLLPPNFL
jgi:hypothetical protein